MDHRNLAYLARETNKSKDDGTVRQLSFCTRYLQAPDLHILSASESWISACDSEGRQDTKIIWARTGVQKRICDPNKFLDNIFAIPGKREKLGEISEDQRNRWLAYRALHRAPQNSNKKKKKEVVYETTGEDILKKMEQEEVDMLDPTDQLMCNPVIGDSPVRFRVSKKAEPPQASSKW